MKNTRRAVAAEAAVAVGLDLPRLPDGWLWSDVQTLAAQNEQPVLTGPFGSTLGRKDFAPDGVPLLTIGCLTEAGITLDKAFYISPGKAEALDRYRVRKGDILFSRSASVGRAGLVSESLVASVINYHLMRLRLDVNLIDPRLFIYFVRGSQVVRAYLREVNHGATRDGINTADLLRMPVAVPPVQAQRRIVTKLDELLSDIDAGVAALERVKANLKRYRASVLKAAVEGRLTEEWRAKNRPRETGEQLLKRILHERRRKWEEDQLAAFAAARKEPPKNWRSRYKEPLAPDTSNLLILPDGWCRSTMEQLTIRSEYGTSVKCDYRANGLPVLRIPNIAAETINLDDLKFSTQPLAVNEDDCLHRGDLLMCRTNGSIALIGKAAVVQRSFSRPHTFASYLLRFRFCDPETISGWVHAFVSSVSGRRFIERNAASSAGQHNISLSLIHRMPIPLAPLAEQRAIIAAIDERLSRTIASSHEIESGLRRAVRLRQSIFKCAFEGKLVAQDPADEPAAVLLARIEQSRAAASAMRTKSKPHSDEFLRRAAIASYTIKRLAPQPSFGRTQLEKTLHLAQSHLGIDLGLEFERYAAGPFDKSIYRLEGTANKSGWFTKKNRPRVGVTYHPGPKIDSMCQHAARLLGDKQAAFDRLLDHIATMNTDEAELFSTAYAAWNDLLIDGRNADDGAIIKEIYGWDASKKKFTRAAILKRLEWMRRNNYVPTGRGHRTMPMKTSAARREPRGK